MAGKESTRKIPPDDAAEIDEILVYAEPDIQMGVPRVGAPSDAKVLNIILIEKATGRHTSVMTQFKSAAEVDAFLTGFSAGRIIERNGIGKIQEWADANSEKAKRKPN